MFQIVAHLLLRRALEITRGLRPLPQHLHRLQNILRLVVVGVTQSRGPLNVPDLSSPAPAASSRDYPRPAPSAAAPAPPPEHPAAGCSRRYPEPRSTECSRS